MYPAAGGTSLLPLKCLISLSFTIKHYFPALRRTPCIQQKQFIILAKTNNGFFLRKLFIVLESTLVGIFNSFEYFSFVCAINDKLWYVCMFNLSILCLSGNRFFHCIGSVTYKIWSKLKPVFWKFVTFLTEKVNICLQIYFWIRLVYFNLFIQSI